MDINDGLEGVNEGVNIFNFLKIMYFGYPPSKIGHWFSYLPPLQVISIYGELHLIYIPF